MSTQRTTNIDFLSKASAFALLALAGSCGGKSVSDMGSAAASGDAGGAAASGDAGTGSGGTHPVVTLAVLQAGPSSIAVDDTRVYWLNTSNKTVIACPIASCKPPLTVLADFQPVLSSMVVHDGTLYWGAVTLLPSEDQTIRSCASTGCNDHPATWLGPLRELVGPIAADGQNLYLTTGYGIGVCALAGCNNQEKPLVYVAPRPQHPVLADGVMYWVEGEGVPLLDSPATIKSCAVAGCNQQPTTLVAAASKVGISPSPVEGLAVNDTRVYWSNLDGIWTCPKTACVTPTRMFPQEVGLKATLVVADATNIFVCNSDSILRCAASGCAEQPTVIASFHGGCTSLTQAARAIYWTTYDGTVLMTAK
jgi:hypothetical protein